MNEKDDFDRAVVEWLKSELRYAPPIIREVGPSEEDLPQLVRIAKCEVRKKIREEGDTQEYTLELASHSTRYDHWSVVISTNRVNCPFYTVIVDLKSRWRDYDESLGGSDGRR